MAHHATHAKTAERRARATESVIASAPLDAGSMARASVHAESPESGVNRDLGFVVSSEPFGSVRDFLV